MAVHIKSGSRLNGYTLLTDMANSDAGTSMWAFAEKNGREYFLKCFLSPTYPTDASPGSAKAKEGRRARCNRFEAHTRTVERALARCGDQAFLVRSVDFFRQEGTYFKVTEKIGSKRLSVHGLPPNKQLIVMLTAAYALRALHHRSALVHADLKPENILLHRSGNCYLASLIDFDAAFFVHNPPEKESLIGDQRYWAPELIRHLNGYPATGLSQKVDVFALGSIFCEYLTGQPPVLSDGYAYPGEALLNGAAVTIPAIQHAQLEPVGAIIAEMLEATPEKRPTMVKVHERLRTLNKRLYVRNTTLAGVGKIFKRRKPVKLPVIQVSSSEETGKNRRDSAHGVK